MSKPSAESLSIAAVSIPVRPDPPEDMTDYQKELWRSVTATKPADWFEDDVLPVLEAYCIAAERHRKISRTLNAVDEVKGGDLEKLMRLEDMYAKQIKNIATSLRLTPQSRYNPRAAATASKGEKRGKRPWET